MIFPLLRIVFRFAKTIWGTVLGFHMTSQKDYLVGKINFFRLQIVFSVLLFVEALRTQGIDHDWRVLSDDDHIPIPKKKSMLWDLRAQFVLSILLTLMGIAKQLIGWTAFAKNNIKLYNISMGIDLARGLLFVIYMGGFYDMYRFGWAVFAYLSLASFGLTLFIVKCIQSGAHQFNIHSA